MSRRRRGLLPYLFGFGIVDRLGEPYWSDDCVAQDREPLEGVVESLNDPYPRDEYTDRRPFRVVRLVWISKEG